MNNERYTRPITEGFERVVQVNRVSKKTKGGDKRSLSVIVVVGDRNGKVGVGLGKAADVQSAVAKATSYARRHQISIVLKDGRTIPHEVLIKQGAAKVILKPAPEGTGIIAGGAVRVVAEAAGIKDVVAKILGTKNKASNVYATLAGLSNMKETAQVAEVVREKVETNVEVEDKKVKKSRKE